jgi:hypothetical protein
VSFEYQQRGGGSQLHPELEEILVYLGDRALTKPRAERVFRVLLVDQVPGSLVMGGGIEGQYAAADHDLQELENYGFIQRMRSGASGVYEFFITQRGYEYVQAAKRRGEPLETVEETVERYLNADPFKAKYGEAYAKWRQAAAWLAEDPIENATRIGHESREALQAFAIALGARHGVEESGKGTFDRIRGVIDHYKGALGDRTHTLLSALFDLWRAVSGVAQRQEHGAQREVHLDADDARRCVWYTALVMYELDRTLPHP